MTTLTDNVAGSLRIAIATATAVGGDGLVEFAPGLTGTITLNAGEIPINANLTINGPGPANVTVNANNASRVFNIGSNNITVNISGLKIQGGNSAGGDGGAIFVNFNSLDTLNITNCWLTGNSSVGEGGALGVGGNLNMTACTVSGNSSPGGGGGGIKLAGGPTGTYRLVNCTITGNTTTSSSGGGVTIVSGLQATFFNCTIFNNTSGAGTPGGGIETGIVPITLLNTIVSGNIGGGGSPDIVSGSTVLENFSLIGVLGATVLAPGSGNNQNGQAVTFGPLQFNGGMTPTLALTGSIATNFAIFKGTGNGVVVLVDQRACPAASMPWTSAPSKPRSLTSPLARRAPPWS